jgi:four helix bundle protein
MVDGVNFRCPPNRLFRRPLLLSARKHHMTTSFEHLDAFQFAMDLLVDVYEVTNSFPKREMYGLTSQLRRAGVSVVSHIAEGQGRLTAGEWRQMLSQARGSLYEVQAQIIAATRLGLVDVASSEYLRQRVDRAARPLAGLISWVAKRETEKKRGAMNHRPSTQAKR